MKQDTKLSKEYSKKIVSEVGMCFWNSKRLFVSIEENNAFYVEGFASMAGGKHGWVEIDGRVVDVSPFWTGREDVEYFAGVRYTREQVSKHLSNLSTGEDFNEPIINENGYGLHDYAWRKAELDCLEFTGVQLPEGWKERVEALNGN